MTEAILDFRFWEERRKKKEGKTLYEVGLEALISITIVATAIPGFIHGRTQILQSKI